MTTHNAPTVNIPPTERITCSIPGPRNDRGRPRLLATLDPGGISVYCASCKRAHYVSREQCIAFWERGESVQCHPGEELHRESADGAA